MHLEFQPSFTGAVGQGLDATVIAISATIEDDGFNTGLLRPLGNQLAHQLGGLRFAFTLDLVPQVAIDGRGRGKRVAARVVNHLSVDVAQAAENVQTRALSRA